MDTILTLEQFKANIEVYNFFNGSYAMYLAEQY